MNRNPQKIRNRHHRHRSRHNLNRKQYNNLIRSSYDMEAHNQYMQRDHDKKQR
jgi:hypothetical protein